MFGQFFWRVMEEGQNQTLHNRRPRMQSHGHLGYNTATSREDDGIHLLPYLYIRKGHSMQLLRKIGYPIWKTIMVCFYAVALLIAYPQQSSKEYD